MTKTTRARYTLEFKQETVRLVEGQSQANVARTLGIADQTVFNLGQGESARSAQGCGQQGGER